MTTETMKARGREDNKKLKARQHFLATLLHCKLLSVVARIISRVVSCSNMLHKVELISTLCNILPQRATREVKRATTLNNLQCNNVARQVEGECFLYYWAFSRGKCIARLKWIGDFVTSVITCACRFIWKIFNDDTPTFIASENTLSYASCWLLVRLKSAV